MVVSSTSKAAAVAANKAAAVRHLANAADHTNSMSKRVSKAIKTARLRKRRSFGSAFL